MTTLMAFVVSIILIALIFDYINGFHDAANSIATVVSTRVLSPGLAVIWAAFFNFAAFAIFGTRVACRRCVGRRKDSSRAWILTIPMSALIAALVFFFVELCHALAGS